MKSRENDDIWGVVISLKYAIGRESAKGETKSEQSRTCVRVAPMKYISKKTDYTQNIREEGM